METFIFILLIIIFLQLTGLINIIPKKRGDNYYPNGQLKYDYSEVRMSGPVPSKTTWKKTWYENGQLKSECEEKPYGKDTRKHLKTWYQNGQIKSEYKKENGQILYEKNYDENGKEIE